MCYYKRDLFKEAQFMDNLQYDKMSFLRKMILITVFVLLILWFIFFMRLGVRFNNSIVDNDCDKNVLLMEKAAKKYFTKDVIKDDKFISLKKMYDLKLLDELKTSYGESCIDIASFVKIEEFHDKYKMDIILVCGDNNKTKTVYY